MIGKFVNAALFIISALFCFSDLWLYMCIPLLTCLLSFFHFRNNQHSDEDEAQPANALKVSSIMFNLILWLVALALTLSLMDPKHPSPYQSMGAILIGLITVFFVVSSFNLYRMFQKNG
ncbi:MAG: hypothetical protein MUF42_00660 [Cytophagaceae bacterium]|jgi:hypothetical protein|nr:hypothetical protein [Cytophagaceae bacterium]